MTIKTLEYIHNLLINAEQSAELKVSWMRDEFTQAADDFENGIIAESKYRDIKDQYFTLRADHGRAYEALQDFESKEW